ncbi:hypothetical protein KAFR_0C02910 [Kazachstania africana CBS 2517]|uniref:Uncharacterized protein n=1 Tax=Kazachstania africana (strain ATCC 22294 / BCRC 22015 / CBS 2517 / CECT 1963 / NBRC 1671 / NRRL Y-8276) TaxID=1071382 RepID=H2ASD4_KAZAF|nr:hypothetical protein KAFR_0C02910 [Kazachstania africana CBS 2517]CCF57284.1 hypothetical protein KAFR_0C02910 [Kazachstania africana CBS 2517]
MNSRTARHLKFVASALFVVLVLNLLYKIIAKYLLHLIIRFVFHFPGKDNDLWWQRYGIVEKIVWSIIDYAENTSH